MGTTIATITTSVDGYYAGPDDRAGQGLGIGGERLHYWVMGGPWTYDGEHEPGNLSGADKDFYDDLTATIAAGICGRGMYDGAGEWGGTNPFDGPLFVVTHRVEDQPPDEASGFTFVDGLSTALARARAAAGDGDIAISGGGDVIRQALAMGEVDELALSTAPVVLGAGKRLFDGFAHDLDLETVSVHHSRWATHSRHRVLR